MPGLTWDGESDQPEPAAGSEPDERAARGRGRWRLAGPAERALLYGRVRQLGLQLALAEAERDEAREFARVHCQQVSEQHRPSWLHRPE